MLVSSSNIQKGSDSSCLCKIFFVVWWTLPVSVIRHGSLQRESLFSAQRIDLPLSHGEHLQTDKKISMMCPSTLSEYSFALYNCLNDHPPVAEQWQKARQTLFAPHHQQTLHWLKVGPRVAETKKAKLMLWSVNISPSAALSQRAKSAVTPGKGMAGRCYAPFLSRAKNIWRATYWL